MRLLIDEYKIKYVLRNLLSNAYKSTGHSGDCGSVRIEIRLLLASHDNKGGNSNAAPPSNNAASTNSTSNKHGHSCWKCCLPFSTCCLSSHSKLKPNADSSNQRDLEAGGGGSHCSGNNGNGKDSPSYRHHDAPLHEGAVFTRMVRLSMTDCGPASPSRTRPSSSRSMCRATLTSCRRDRVQVSVCLSPRRSRPCTEKEWGCYSEGRGCGSTFYVDLPAYKMASAVSSAVSSTTDWRDYRIASKLHHQGIKSHPGCRRR